MLGYLWRKHLVNVLKSYSNTPTPTQSILFSLDLSRKSQFSNVSNDYLKQSFEGDSHTSVYRILSPLTWRLLFGTFRNHSGAILHFLRWSRIEIPRGSPYMERVTYPWPRSSRLWAVSGGERSRDNVYVQDGGRIHCPLPEDTAIKTRPNKCSTVQKHSKGKIKIKDHLKNILAQHRASKRAWSAPEPRICLSINKHVRLFSATRVRLSIPTVMFQCTWHSVWYYNTTAHISRRKDTLSVQDGIIWRDSQHKCDCEGWSSRKNNWWCWPGCFDISVQAGAKCLFFRLKVTFFSRNYEGIWRDQSVTST